MRPGNPHPAKPRYGHPWLLGKLRLPPRPLPSDDELASAPMRKPFRRQESSRER